MTRRGGALNAVVGNSGKVRFSLENGLPTLTTLPELNSYDDKDGKPVNIHLHIGQKPILAFGNSDGDQAMLEYVTSRAAVHDQHAGPAVLLA